MGTTTEIIRWWEFYKSQPRAPPIVAPIASSGWDSASDSALTPDLRPGLRYRLRFLVAPPKFEHEQCVQPLGMIDAFLLVLLDQPLDDFHVEVRTCEGVRCKEVISEHRTQFAAKPFADR